MPTFRYTEELYAVQGAFLDEITKGEKLRPRFVGANTSFRTTPIARRGSSSIAPTTLPVVTCDVPTDTEVEIGLKMGAEDGHKFWLGQLNLTARSPSRVRWART